MSTHLCVNQGTQVRPPLIEVPESPTSAPSPCSIDPASWERKNFITSNTPFYLFYNPIANNNDISYDNNYLLSSKLQLIMHSLNAETELLILKV